jgi:hypothetical protein
MLSTMDILHSVSPGHAASPAASLHPARFRHVGVVAVAAALITIVGVSVAPIVTFVLMISAFGLPHVIYELRYCDERFSSRTSRSLLAMLGVLLGLIALGRVGNGMHWIPSSIFVPMELGLGAALALIAAYHMRQHKWLGALIGIVFTIGATYFPLETFLIWAWLHNLTPVGFVAEATRGEERLKWMAVLFVPFVVLPGLVATGVFHQMIGQLISAPGLYTSSIFGAGDIPLMSFLPPQSYDLNLFSAAVVAQAMHYVAVIVLLPRLQQAQGRAEPAHTLVAWPDWRSFAFLVAVIAAVAFGIYAVSYTDAKAGYAVAAAIHAWIELPILLMALGQGFTSSRT